MKEARHKRPHIISPHLHEISIYERQIHRDRKETKGSWRVEKRWKDAVKPVESDSSDACAYVNISNAAKFYTYRAERASCTLCILYHQKQTLETVMR